MFRFMTAGESHGPCLTAIIEGIPAGLEIDIHQINRDLARRQQGFGRGGRMKIEKDTAKILSGVRFKQTLGSPITLTVENRDWENWEDRMSATGSPSGDPVVGARPGHADLTGVLKYNRQDIRDILERASARETAARVAVGALSKQLLAACGMKVTSHVTCIGGISIQTESRDFQYINEHRNASDLGCIDPEAEIKMREKILQTKEQGDTLGGIFEVLVENPVPGLGSHIQWDRRLDAKMASAFMSIPAIKGVEIGDGFAYAYQSGSESHDEIYHNADKGYYRLTNHAGGIEGGMSNGELLIVRAAMKSIPTLMKPLASVNIATKEKTLASTERSDVCAVTAAAVVGEAMASIVLAELVIEKFGGDNMQDLVNHINSYRHRISS